MEFEFQFILMILVSFFLFIFIALKLLGWFSLTNSTPLNPIPGPKKLPLIGHLHLLILNPLPHRAFRDLATKYGPLMHLHLGEVPFLIVSSPHIAKQILKTHDINFANRPPMVMLKTMTYNYSDIVLSPYGAHWRNLRKICILEALSAKRVQSFRGIREEENLNLAKWIASNEGLPINLSDCIFLSSYDITTRATLGKKTVEKGIITAIIKAAAKLASGLSIADLYPSIGLLALISGAKFRIDRMHRKADRILDSIIDKHRLSNDISEKREVDLVDVLLKYEDDGTEDSLTTDNIKAVLWDILSGGSETSATVLEWAMSEMLNNSTTVLKKAQDEVRHVFDAKGYVDEADFHELKYLKLVIKETMRLHMPAPLLLPRQSVEPCEINGCDIPAKTRVIINAWAIARDPEYWNDPDKFIPERFLDNTLIDYKGNSFEYLPFGSGRRVCPGVSFGLANVEFPLAMLLYHFDWKMPNGVEHELLDMTETFGGTVRRKHDLHLVPILRRPLQLVD